MTFKVHRSTASRFKVGTYAAQLSAIPPRSGLNLLVPHHERQNVYNAARREKMAVRSWSVMVGREPMVYVIRTR